jgi:hypothetical protein
MGFYFYCMAIPQASGDDGEKVKQHMQKNKT